jgi:cell division protease FtsH
VIAGPEKKTRVMSEKERRVTAFHEMGHALVAHYLQHTDPVHKISVISRGQALGYTISLPTEDKFLTTRAELSDTMAMTLGGRAAEEIVFGEVTTGASNDLEKVTATAKQMVMRFGMSEKLGPRVFGHDHGQPFLGREFSSELARQVLEEHRKALDVTSEILLRRETIEREQFIELLDGKTEEEVFGAEEPPVPVAPSPTPEAPERKPERAPKTLPRPGLAGGTAEMRANDPLPPEKP